jgi:hypothetical protein
MAVSHLRPGAHALTSLLSQSTHFPVLALAGLTLNIDVIAHRPTPTRRTPEPDTEAGPLSEVRYRLLWASKS